VTIPRWAVIAAIVAGVAFYLATRWASTWLSLVVVVAAVILIKGGQLLGVRVRRRGGEDEVG
jgi:hypothetical protein